ncbi:hypothetical protein RFI_21804 [Reticulomyxa filosa]|uniref:Kelch motif family protein n=1 Tax=Reticulomyxa filosa TaxID=46433 RepID=X6MNX9_RETFI|nr:hypothetical protein RFI_21804 [Reticulomyxa filosa]|eukprot:ETO15559.1 hypothetical protein RFI_21804 [Reticulomyxa filosa]
MANRIKSFARKAEQIEQGQHIITLTPFQALKDLPTSLTGSQCVPHKHEILICGGYDQRDCYSYDTLKNKYKFICEYPNDVYLEGHCVVKLVNNNKDRNQITLLSFGGMEKHTLIMKYVSIWGDDNEMNKLNKSNNYNQWVPFTNNNNHPIIIGRDEDDYDGVRAVIGGGSNNLLFITYWRNNISVFDLNTFQFIKHHTLPISSFTSISYHCFKKNYEMLLFYKKTGLSIEYNEDKNVFQFNELSVRGDIASLNYYAYVCINDIVLFFGGYGNHVYSGLVHKYLIQESKWITFQSTLSSPLKNCVAILSEDDTNIHILGGQSDEKTIVSIHMKTKVHVWDASQLIKLGWIDDFDQIIFKYSRKK